MCAGGLCVEMACWLQVGGVRAKTAAGFYWSLDDTCQMHSCKGRVRKAGDAA